ncbi:MAG: LPS export ABC transporter periplasmic protein LptC [Verrucomicrobia bacterium]|nr:LPS export ABC transporter periplasmic protein LptC [Verrucomicrobiota bacterium]
MCCLAAALALLAAAPAGAQTTGSVQTVAGFRVPDYDEQNNLKSVLFGDFARILPDGIIEITNLKIDFYREGATNMTVTSPKCIYNQKENTARSDADVEIRREKLRITGTGFWWSAKQERFEIFHKARVEIQGARGHMESGGLP